MVKIEITRHLNVCGPVPVTKWGWCVTDDDLPIHASPSYDRWADMISDLETNGRQWLQPAYAHGGRVTFERIRPFTNDNNEGETSATEDTR